jgi:hypothetical protein
VEDRISELKDKIDIKEKEKTEESLDKRLKSCKRNMQICNSIKRPNLQIMGTEKEEEVQPSSTTNIQQSDSREFPKY